MEHAIKDANYFTFIWILENFEFCSQEVLQGLSSPKFIVDEIGRSKWCLWIYPRGSNSEGWISIFLHREADSKGPADIDLDFELAFLASDGSELTLMDSIDESSFMKNSTLGFACFEERDSVFGKRLLFLPQDALTVRCRMWKCAGNFKVKGKCTARTRIGVEKRTFEWKIPNFSSFNVMQKNVYKLKSISDDGLIMSLIFFLRNIGNSVSILINFNPSDKSIGFSRFKCSLIAAKGDFVDCGQNEIWFLPNVQSVEITLPLSKGAVMDNKTEYLPNDVLTLYCEQVFSTGVALNAIESMSYNDSGSYMKNNITPENIETACMNKSNAETPALKLDISSMLHDNILCDIKLCVESESFPAHWFILIARSPVFRAMFESDMKERSNQRIDIEDLKPDTVRRMLHYMYTDSLDDLQWETASDLYAAAEKYQIMTLKDKCSSFLKSNLSFTNACEVLLLADLHQDKELKSMVQDFILENDKRIINSSEWKLLMQTNVHLAAETMVLRYKE